ncbi:PREDICTED: uncharacterized protein LOC108663599 [Theobroma cacao]|uniref:Uncharacterized protein LOC108663599 n=1 Tax=Theobroma cacao TaxID=3641 RepID=A0AB32WYH4_THECC|nr:PREDICTED: uncharacterized protein LOC108663599 [Theobroma cacao]
MTVLFINTLRAPFYGCLIGNATKNFTNLVLFGEIIERAIKIGKIEGHEVASSKKGSMPKKKEGDVQTVAHDSQQAHNFSPYHIYPPYQPFYPNIGNIAQNPYVYQPAPQPTFQTNVLPQAPPPRPVASTNNSEPLRPPFPKWYDPNAHCDYHFGIQGHSTENCTALKHKVQVLIKAGLLNFAKKDNSNVDGNFLPNHGGPIVNAIHEGIIRRVKKNVNEIQTLMDRVFEALSKINTITPEPIDTKELGHDLAHSCKFHMGAIEHSIQNCDSFRSSFEDLTGLGGITRSGRCYSLEIAEKVEKGKPAQGEGGLKEADTFSKDQVVESVVAPNNEVKRLVTKKEAGEFLKFIKHSEYSVVEQLTRMPARISLLSLLLNSKANRNVLLKVLNQAYVAQDISMEKLDHIVGNITVGNFIAFNDEEISSGGQ